MFIQLLKQMKIKKEKNIMKIINCMTLKIMIEKMYLKKLRIKVELILEKLIIN